MANIIDNLNTLNTNLDNTKFKIAKNLKDKGVQALPSDKLDILADKIVDIPSGSCNLQELNVTENGTYTPQAGDVKGYNKVTVNVPNSGGGDLDFKSLGFIIPTGEEQEYKDTYKINQETIAALGNYGTSLNNAFSNKKIKYAPYLDTSKVTDFEDCFLLCRLNTFPKWNLTSAINVTSMYMSAFGENFQEKEVYINIPNAVNCSSFMDNSTGCASKIEKIRINAPLADNCVNMFSTMRSLKEVKGLDGVSKTTFSATNYDAMFMFCESLTESPIIDISKATNISRLFGGCSSLTSIYLSGKLPDDATIEFTFYGLPTNGDAWTDYPRSDNQRLWDYLNSEGRNWEIHPGIPN